MTLSVFLFNTATPDCFCTSTAVLYAVHLLIFSFLGHVLYPMLLQVEYFAPLYVNGIACNVTWLELPGLMPCVLKKNFLWVILWFCCMQSEWHIVSHVFLALSQQLGLISSFSLRRWAERKKRQGGLQHESPIALGHIVRRLGQTVRPAIVL